MDGYSAQPEKQLDEKIMQAWRSAAEQLGIRVEIPFTFTTKDGETKHFEARVIDFGGPNGIVLGVIGDDKSTMKQREEAGYSWSDLSPTYESYDREHFIATLDDWGWFGPERQEPAWYSGKGWS